ncbi:A24 family peptidase [Granulosicoccaceae sp. 1_MG-2023]|nr:A24 family peptidase [Granulosicoccaceae sp. 1_MG-2023]
MSDLIATLQANHSLFIAVVAMFSLFVGSFLNVVIHRLPIMMENGWRRECREFIAQDSGQPLPEDEAQPTFNLMVPRSRCPSCGQQINALQNIPILSYLLLKGKCGNCGTGISVQYPIIEAVTMILSVMVALKFGVSLQTLFGIFLTWALISLTMIDFKHTLLPDDITLPMLWLGLLISLVPVFVSPSEAIVGAVVGYLALWSVYHLFKLVTGKEGMGYGDFKLLGLLGAWFGWASIPMIILLSSVVGAVVGISLIVIRGRDRNIPIPFGPYLAAAGWLAMMYGDTISRALF